MAQPPVQGEQALSFPDELCDLVLTMSDGRQLAVPSQFLRHASTVLHDALACSADSRKRPREEPGASIAAQQLTVEGTYPVWLALLKYLCAPFQSATPATLTPSTAFAIYPIAHAYDMRSLLAACVAVVKQHPPPLAETVQASGYKGQIERPGAGGGSQAEAAAPPAEGGAAAVAPAGAAQQLNNPGQVLTGGPVPPGPSGQATHTHAGSAAVSESLDGRTPAFLEWLTLVDQRKHMPLLDALVEQISDPGAPGARGVLRSLMARPETRQVVERLSAATLAALLNASVDLPLGFQGVRVPDLSSQPTYHGQVSPSLSCHSSLLLGTASAPILARRITPTMAGPQIVNGQPVANGLDEVEIVVLTDGAVSRISWPEELGAATGRVAAICGKGNSLMVAYEAGCMHAWTLGSPLSVPPTRRRSFRFNPYKPSAMCFAGQRVAVGLHDESGCWLHLLDLETGSDEPMEMGRDDNGHLSRARMRNLRARPDGNLIVSSGTDGILCLWDPRVGCCNAVRVIETPTVGGTGVLHFAMDDSGSLAVCAVAGEPLSLWDLGSGRHIHTLESDLITQQLEARGGSCTYMQVEMDGSGTTALSCGIIGRTMQEVHEWDLSRGVLTRTTRFDMSVSELCILSNSDGGGGCGGAGFPAVAVVESNLRDVATVKLWTL